METLRGIDGAVTEFKEKLWAGMVESITVGKEDGMTVRFKGGVEIKISS